jgi:hypothetical protein
MRSVGYFPEITLGGSDEADQSTKSINFPDYALFSANKAWYKIGTQGCFLRV